MNQPRRRSGERAKSPRYFYLSDRDYQAVLAVCPPMSFSGYVAAAVLERARRDGAILYGVRGGACLRAAPEREEAARCATGSSATWWNKNEEGFYCETCARALNQFVPYCVSPEEMASAFHPVAADSTGEEGEDLLARLRDLAERLRRVPVMYGVDDGDVYLCEEVASALRTPDPNLKLEVDQ